MADKAFFREESMEQNKKKKLKRRMTSSYKNQIERLKRKIRGNCGVTIKTY